MTETETMQYRKIKDLTELSGNPRKIDKKSFEILVKSISENKDYFEARPLILSNRTGKLVILAGNMRFKAAKRLKMIECPTFLMKGLTEAKEKEIIIRDNVSNGEWDWDVLGKDWGVTDLSEWGVVIPDFNKADLKAEEDDFVIPDKIKTNIKLGDLIEIGKHRLICGDSTDKEVVKKLMSGKEADMVFTDPPYGVNYEGGHNNKKRKGIENDKLKGADLTNLFRDSLQNAILFSKDNSAFYIWYANGKAVETFSSFSELNLNVRAVICWYKINSGLGAFMSQYIPNYEPCIYAHKKGKSPQWFGATDEKTVWELKKESRNEFHPTQKPVELCGRAIKNSSKKNDIILDVFLGSGTTMVACEQTNRICYAVELSTEYCQVIINRMQNLIPNIAVKVNGKPYKIPAKK